MYSNKVVVIAGGSKGLGLELAMAFARQGATLVLLARNQDRLNQASVAVSETAVAEPVCLSVDLSDDEATSRAVSQILEQTGQIDVWINAIGQSIRTSFSDCSAATYRQLMEQNCFASINGSLACLDALESTGGSLVNIGSLASKTAWPLLAPYVTSKHALAGFAKQLQLEGPANVHYLFVCPGPIHSRDGAERYSQQSQGLPDAARKPGAGAPVKAIDPVWLAEKIVAACRQRKKQIVVPQKSQLLFVLCNLFPGWADALVRRFSK